MLESKQSSVYASILKVQMSYAQHYETCSDLLHTHVLEQHVTPYRPCTYHAGTQAQDSKPSSGSENEDQRATAYTLNLGSATSRDCFSQGRPSVRCPTSQHDLAGIWAATTSF